MRSFRKSLGFVTLAALSLSMVACHGQSSVSPSYLPPSTTGLSTPQTAASGVDESKESKIVSSCGRRIHIVVAGIIDCKFHEKGHKDRRFTLHDHTHGLVLISPRKGTRETVFTVTGVAVGSGDFVVRDRHGNHAKVRVRVTL